MSTVEYNPKECFPKSRFVVAKDETAQFTSHIVAQWWLALASETASQPKPKSKPRSSYIVSYASQTPPDLSRFVVDGKSLAEQKAEKLALAIESGKESGLIPPDAPITRETYDSAVARKLQELRQAAKKEADQKLHKNA